ncbi:hypothetical protein [Teredinibacter turnerae]|uniref:hypothetical protein n=1 Tax=Teredinibacter turnerae TaxID=2426 RepID=UPI000421F7B5|nr:hypothetical protein [Teredinibacter turnerae]
MLNKRNQAEIFSVTCFMPVATLAQNNPLQIFRCCGRYKPMKNIVVMLALFALTSCVSPQQRALNNACESSKNARVFPKGNTVAKIHVQFHIGTGEDQINVNETAICDYQGSFCPAGDWYEVWYGNKEMKREIVLTDDRKLSIWHHGLCINLDEYKKQCAKDVCGPTDYFRFRLQLNTEETSQRKLKCAERNTSGVTNDPDEFVRCGIPNVDLVTLEELKNYGYMVNGESIEVINDGL